MNRWILLLFAFSCFLSPFSAFAQKESDDEPVDEAPFAKIVELGPGVHMINKSKKGRILSCVVVGQARISTALGKAKGLELAREKANLACSAEFVKWLKEGVTVFQSNDEETVILLEGEESEELDSLKESGKSIEKSGKKMESLSKGIVRGLQLIHKEVDGDGQTYTIIKGWKADNSDGVKRLAADLGSDKVQEKPKNKGDEGKKSAKNKNIDKEIESGSVTSEDAKDYLPKRVKN